MKQELIAPQFGLAARRIAEDISEPPEVRPPASAVAYSGASAFRPATGPVVVVKTVKRKKFEIGVEPNGAAKQQPTVNGNSANGANGANGVASEGGADGAKAPKVFILAPLQRAAEPDVAQLKQQPVSDASTATADMPSTAVARRRRRRDPATVPVLVRHVVYERPETEEVPQQQQQLESSSHGDVSYKDVCRALQQLRTKVEAAMRVRDRLAEIVLPRARKG